jgi:small subunit ribosomal protein S2
MGGLPDVMIVIDTGKEKIAVAEARKLGIPVIGICDTNADPTVIDHPIPANDDALRAINLYCDLFSQAVLDGIQAEMGAADEDIGALEQPIEEPVIAAEEAEAAAEAAPAAAEEAPAAEAGAEEAGEAPKA